MMTKINVISFFDPEREGVCTDHWYETSSWSRTSFQSLMVS